MIEIFAVDRMNVLQVHTFPSNYSLQSYGCRYYPVYHGMVSLSLLTSSKYYSIDQNHKGCNIPFIVILLL